MNGVVIGTPPFVSPEQARGDSDAVDTRSDVYVLGAILYAILTLRAPVEGLRMEETLHRIIQSDLRKPTSYNAVTVKKKSRRAQMAATQALKATERIELLHCPNQRIPEGLSAIVMKAMELEPANRYQSVVELQADLTAHQAGFATKAERASMWRQALLFGGRHKRELAIFLTLAVVIQALLVDVHRRAQPAEERGEGERAARAGKREVRAGQRSARPRERRRAGQGARGAARHGADLCPGSEKFARRPEAGSGAREDRLRDRAGAERGHLSPVAREHFAIAHAVQRSDHRVQGGAERQPNLKGVKENIALTKGLLSRVGEDGSIPPSVTQNLHSELVNQKRVGEALAVVNRDQKAFVIPGKAALDRNGNKGGEKREDGSLYIDLSRETKLELRKLRFFNVTGVNFDDTRLQDLSAIKGLPLTALSLGHTNVRDLSPLAGMPLRSLNIEGTQVTDLAPLAGMPLEILRMGGTRVENLNQLVDFPLEQLNIAGCREIKDLTPLAGMPLQKVDLSRTGVSDLKPLIHSPIRELDLEGCVDIMDLKPLMAMKSLETVRIPTQCIDIALPAQPSVDQAALVPQDDAAGGRVLGGVGCGEVTGE